MTHEPLISVVMATYNGESFIAEAIQSVLDQSFRDFEFIIVNDGSTDGTEQIIKEFRDDRIVYFKKELNSGIADSLNLGIAKASGTYIARMDDDDVCKPQRFERQLEVFNQYDNLVFCGSAATNKDGKCLVTPEKHQDILLKLLFSNPIFHPTALILRTSLMEEAYNPSAVPSEDYDLWSRLIFKGQFYQIQEPLLYVRLHQTSVTANRRKEQLIRSVLIAQRIYDTLGLISNPQKDKLLIAYTIHDYNISAVGLRSLIHWFINLKANNKKLELFDEVSFNDEANKHLKRFIVSYFLNNSIIRKIKSFIYLPFYYKKIIISYYLHKNTN